MPITLLDGLKDHRQSRGQRYGLRFTDRRMETATL